MGWVIGLIPAPLRLYTMLALLAFVAAGAATASWQLRDVFADRDIAKLELSYERGRLAQAEAIARSKDHARAAEAAERAANQQIEVKANENAKRTNTLLADNRRLARLAGGLRDPYALRCTDLSREAGTPGSLEDRAAKGEFPRTPAGLLSQEASEFLLEFAAQCDAAADYAQAGHDYAVKGN